MRRAILAVLALVCVLALPAAASAEPKPKNKLYLTVGGAFNLGNGAIGHNSAVQTIGPGLVPYNADFDDVFGKGMSFSGYIGGSLTDNFSAQIGWIGDFHESGTFADLNAHWFLAEFKANLRMGRVDPYILGGIGGAVGSIKLPGAAANLDTGIEFAMTYGGGAEIYLTDTFAISPEVRVKMVHDRGVWIYPVSLGASLFFLMD